MYSLDINFLNDREVASEAGEERQPLADKQFLIGGGAIALVRSRRQRVRISLSSTPRKACKKSLLL